MFRINLDCDGYFIRYKMGNLNNYICEWLKISIRKFNNLVRKHNGVITIERERRKNFYGHRFNNIDDCKKFIVNLECLIIMEKLIK